MDPLSDVLSLLKPHNQYFVGFDAAGDWSFDFPPHQGIKFTAVMHGRCWGHTAGREPVLFEEGDCFLLNSGQRLLLASDPALPPQAPDDLMANRGHNDVLVHNGGGEVFLIGGGVGFAGSHAAVLFDALPPMIDIPGSTDQAEVLRWSLNQMAGELRDPRPGGALMATHLVQLMLVQALRLFLGASHALPQGWFLALTDPQVSRAIVAMHADPARRWTLEELARTSGVSRTVFAQRFKALTGGTAMDYLAHWRMLMAADRLRGGSDSVSTIAYSLGYESESSFSTAFKRIMTRSPSQYRRQPPGNAGNDPPRPNA